jgi:cyclohexanecarboxylate-CoA ligase
LLPSDRRFDLPLTEVCVWLEGENISKVKWPERLEIVEEMSLTPTRKIIKGEY